MDKIASLIKKGNRRICKTPVCYVSGFWEDCGANLP